MTPRGAQQPIAESGNGKYWYTVWILTLVATIGYVDRAILSYFVVPIRRDLGISDLQISVLLGFAFILLYGALTVPMGYLADRINRKRMIAAGSVCWSVMTIVTGSSRNFWQMFAGRVGLGMGEAVLPPAGLSIIRDTVPLHARGRAISLYNLVALNVGSGVAGLFSAGILALSARHIFATWPFLAALRPWQVCIVLSGVTGLLLGLLVLTIREPARARSSLATGAGFRQAIVHVANHRRLYLFNMGAVVVANMAATGWSAWLPAVLGVRWSLSAGEVASRLGILQLFLGAAGALIVGWAMDRCKTRRVDGAIVVAMVASAIHLCPALFVLVAPDKTLMWTALALRTVIGTGVTVVSIMVLAEVTPVELLGKITALFYLAVNLCGNAVGPTIFAAAAALASPDGRVTAVIMLGCYATLILLSILLLAATGSALRRWYDEGPS